MRHTGINATTARSWYTVAMPVGQRILGRVEGHRLPVDEQFALGRLVQAGDDLDQRRLAGTVVAEHTGHLAGTHPQVDVLERDDVSVALPDALELDQRGLAPERGFGDRGFSSCTHIGFYLPLRGVVTEGVVGDHREQQHGAQEELEPVRVPAGIDDALVDHAEDERADQGADRGAVPAGEQAATDDRGDDVEELVAHALTRTESC